ncbi:DUF3644 domain-containing protein [Shewanella benthica]|nr:DUF3644 domain-containing protein [Shewanella benthica]
MLALIDYLRKMDKLNREFTNKDASSATGYPTGSISKYLNEKLNGVYVSKQARGVWLCKGIDKLSNDEFVRLMSQSLQAKELTTEEKMYTKLIDRSLDAFTLALEVYNRPSLRNRVEAFTIMIINAWELLLKAEILKTLGYDKVFKKNGKSISVSDAVALRIQENDDVRKNLSNLIVLRDQAIHLLIPELQSRLSRLFQASVLNYQDRYLKQMGNSPLAGQSVGMLSLIIDGPEPEIAIIKENYGLQTAIEVESFLEKFNLESKNSSDNFSISIDYNLTLTRKKHKSDLNLSVGDSGENAIIIREAKDLNISHPFHTEEARALISKKAGKLNQHEFQAILYKHNVKGKRHEFHDFTDRHRYSQKFVDWVVLNLNQPDWLDKAKKQYKSR